MLSNRLLPCVLLALTVCGPPAGETHARADFEPVADVAGLMRSVVDPAAEVYWDAVGWIDDLSGTLEIVPQSSEDWEAVRNAAVVLAESGNLLMMRDALPEREPWTSMSRALIDVGRQAIDAAEARDPARVFRVGGDIYAACTACHAKYALETLPPSDLRR